MEKFDYQIVTDTNQWVGGGIKATKLTDSELKSLFTTENTEDLSDDGIVGEIKRYILSGKRDFTMGKKINEIEKLTMMIVVSRWLKSV